MPMHAIIVTDQEREELAELLYTFAAQNRCEGFERAQDHEAAARSFMETRRETGDKIARLLGYPSFLDMTARHI